MLATIKWFRANEIKIRKEGPDAEMHKEASREYGYEQGPVAGR